jgi:hypothetical protein
MGSEGGDVSDDHDCNYDDYDYGCCAQADTIGLIALTSLLRSR